MQARGFSISSQVRALVRRTALGGFGALATDENRLKQFAVDATHFGKPGLLHEAHKLGNRHGVVCRPGCVRDWLSSLAMLDHIERGVVMRCMKLPHLKQHVPRTAHMAHAVRVKLHLGAHVQSGVVAHRDEAQTAGRKATMKVLEGHKDVRVREKMWNRVIASDYNI